MGDRNILDFRVGDHNLLDFSVGSELTWFYVEVETNLFCIEINLVFVSGGIEIDFFFRGGVKLTWYQCWDQNEIGFCVRDRN